MSQIPWNVDWLVPQWPAPAGVKALCTTRTGGASMGAYASLNLGTHVGDNAQQVQYNRAIVRSALGVNPVFMNQVHGNHVLELETVDEIELTGDGASTRSRGIACTVMVADCLPVLLCDVQGKRVAAVHAGWRGLAGTQGVGVLDKVVERFLPSSLGEYAQPATEVIAWLGPCIGPQAFEVGSEVREEFVNPHVSAAQCFCSRPGGKWLADLPALARQRLQALGVSRVYGNDGSAQWCTVGNTSRFFSHRRDRITGRQAACIWLV